MDNSTKTPTPEDLAQALTAYKAAFEGSGGKLTSGMEPYLVGGLVGFAVKLAETFGLYEAPEERSKLFRGEVTAGQVIRDIKAREARDAERLKAWREVGEKARAVFYGQSGDAELGDYMGVARDVAEACELDWTDEERALSTRAVGQHIEENAAQERAPHGN